MLLAAGLSKNIIGGAIKGIKRIVANAKFGAQAKAAGFIQPTQQTQQMATTTAAVATSNNMLLIIIGVVMTVITVIALLFKKK